MLSTFRSLSWLRSLALPLVLLCLTAFTLACGGSAPQEEADAAGAPTEDAAPAEPQEPAQFRDGFESGDTSRWSGEGDGSEDDGSDVDGDDTPETPSASDG